MKTNRNALMLVAALSLFSSTVYSVENASLSDEPETYGQIVGRKASSSFANIVLAPMELPRNVINTINDTNLVLGFFGGAINGVMHMAGRLGVGMADLITMPIPTSQMVYPLMPWEEYDTETTFGSVLKGKDIKSKAR